VVPQVDLRPLRDGTAFIALSVMLFGLIWNREG